MPVHRYRELKPSPEAGAIYRRWLARLNDEFTRHTKPEIRSQIVRDKLVSSISAGLPRSSQGDAQPRARHALPRSKPRPRNATLEPQYYGEVDAEKYAAREPLIWFWQIFDRSPIGLNHDSLPFPMHARPPRLPPPRQARQNLPQRRVPLRLQPHRRRLLHHPRRRHARRPREIILHEGASVSDYADIYSTPTTSTAGQRRQPGHRTRPPHPRHLPRHRSRRSQRRENAISEHRVSPPNPSLPQPSPSESRHVKRRKDPSRRLVEVDHVLV